MDCADRYGRADWDHVIAMSHAPSFDAGRLPGEREGYLTANGLRLRVREWGQPDAVPIVLLHGLRGYSGTWRRLASALPSDFRLIAYDQRGRGDSAWDPGCNYYTDAYLADLEAVVDSLALPRFVLVGHSMGGTTSYVYAAKHPKRLLGLIIEDIAPGSSAAGAGASRILREMANLPLSFKSWDEARAYWRQTRPSVGEEALEERLAESLREDTHGTIQWRYDAAGISRTRMTPDPTRVVDLWPVVESLSVPTLVIRGERTDFCAADTVARMVSGNPHIDAVTVAGATHYVHDDAPEVFAKHVSQFLARVATPTN